MCSLKVYNLTLFDRILYFLRVSVRKSGRYNPVNVGTYWVTKILTRNNFTMRSSTTVCQKPPEEYAEKIINFLVYYAPDGQKVFTLN